MSEQERNTAVTPTVPVTISAADRGTRIILVDASFGALATGVGNLRMDLVPGLYKARFKTGDRIEDELFEVRDQPVEVRGKSLQFSSPIPLLETSSNREYHYKPSRELAMEQPDCRLGTGGEVFLFARDSRHELGSVVESAPWEDLCVRTADRQVLFSIDRAAHIDALAGYASSKLALDPGLYYLTQPDCVHPGILLQLPFVVCADWCTHVYIDSREVPANETSASSAPRRVLDLVGAAMAMIRVREQRGLQDDVARLSEIARQGLLHGDDAVSEADLDAMIAGKAVYPMFGLYAAHVLLAREPVDWPRIATIATNLHGWFGGSVHPDVEILMAICERHGCASVADPDLSLWPPLLSRTWDLALAHNLKLHDWALQYRVGGALWSCQFRPEEPRHTAEGPASGTDSSSLAELFASTEIADLKVELLSRAAMAAEQQGLSTLMREAERKLDRISLDIKQKIRRQRLPGAVFSAGSTSAIGATWKALGNTLKNPDPEAPPMQQAIRRRLLDFIADLEAGDESSASLTNLEGSIEALAIQFRVSPRIALASANSLLRGAFPAIEQSGLQTPTDLLDVAAHSAPEEQSGEFDGQAD